MLKIKLARFGKKGQPHYRIVVNEARSKRDGAYVAKLGEYVPTSQPKILKLDKKAYDEWIAKGAQPTETVAVLAARADQKDPFPAKKPRLSKKAKAKAAEAKEKPAGATEKPTEVEQKPAEAAAPAEDQPAETPAPAEEKAEETEEKSPEGEVKE